MFRVALLAFVALIAVACSGPRYVDYFPYHDDGSLKPKVALAPMIDSSNCGVSWDVADEISQGIYCELMNSGDFYVPTGREIGPVWANAKEINFFGDDLSYTREMRNTDFIVAMEIIEHSINTCDSCNQFSKPISGKCAPNRSLSIRVRIKIIDIRCECPKIILYEIFKTCYTLTPSKSSIDCDQICWKDEGYFKTPCGIAHDRLVRNLTARLEEVIWSAK